MNDRLLVLRFLGSLFLDLPVDNTFGLQMHGDVSAGLGAGSVRQAFYKIAPASTTRYCPWCAVIQLCKLFRRNFVDWTPVLSITLPGRAPDSSACLTMAAGKLYPNRSKPYQTQLQRSLMIRIREVGVEITLIGFNSDCSWHLRLQDMLSFAGRRKKRT